MKAKKDSVQKYNVFQNVIYCLKNIWHWDKSFFAAFIPKIFLGVLLPLATIYFPKIIIDMITNKSSHQKLLLFISAFCTLFILFELISVFTNAKINSLREIFSTQYNDMCDKKYRVIDYQSTEEPEINSLYNNAVNHTYDAENVVDTLDDFFINLLGIVSYSSIIVVLNPIILVLIIGFTTINFFIFKSIRKYINKNWRKWASIDKKNGYLYSINYAFEHIKDIKLYPYTGLINDITDRCHNERLYWHKKVWNREMLPSIIDIILSFLRNGVVYYILLSQLINGNLNVGMFVFYFGAITGFSLWLNSISGQINNILTMSMNINFIRSFLEIKDNFYRGKTQNLRKEINKPPYSIELKNLTFSYPNSKNNIINNINIKIEKGEKIALVGSNGAGKTTLVKLICGLYYPKSGDVKINGSSVKNINIDEYYKLFSVVFQDLHLMPITIAQFVSGNGVNIDRQKVLDCLKLAGLYERVESCLCGIDTTFHKDLYEHDPGVELSGGEKQKLLLARALYKDAPIIILDEPTAALDPIAESKIYQKFNQIAKNKTAIFISHRLASTRFCDRIFLLEKGEITECGSHERLMKAKGKYYEMFNIQSHYYKENIEEDSLWI